MHVPRCYCLFAVVVADAFVVEKKNIAELVDNSNCQS